MNAEQLFPLVSSPRSPSKTSEKKRSRHVTPDRKERTKKSRSDRSRSRSNTPPKTHRARRSSIEKSPNSKESEKSRSDRSRSSTPVKHRRVRRSAEKSLPDLSSDIESVNSEKSVEVRKHVKTPSTTKVMPAPPPPPSASTTSRKMKETITQLFGEISDDEDVGGGAGASLPRKENLVSSIVQRVANGTSRQVFNDKTGSHYVEIKIYNCKEIENVPPMNRWRQSIVSIKNRTDINTEAWKHLAMFISTTRVEFKDIPANYVGAYQF